MVLRKGIIVLGDFMYIRTTLLSFAAALVFLPTLSLAEDEPDGGVIPGTPFISQVAQIDYCLDAKPGSECSTGYVRELGIHRTNPGAAAARYHYLHRPALLPLRAPDEQSQQAKSGGWSDIVWSTIPTEESDSNIFLEMKILMSNPDIQRIGEDKLRSTPSEVDYLTANGNPSDGLQEIDVSRWNVDLLTMEIRQIPTGKVLARVVDERDADDQGIWNLLVPVEEDGIEALKSALRTNLVEFHFLYSYPGSRTAKQATLNAGALVDVKQQLEQHLKSSQLAIGKPISQLERDDLQQFLRMITGSSITTNDKDLLKTITGAQVQKAFAGLFEGAPEFLSVEDLYKNDKLESVGKFLQPVYDELVSVVERYDETTLTEESKSSVKFGAGIKVGDLGFNFDVANADLARIQEKHGVRFTDTNNDKILEPHQISVSYLANNAAAAVREGIYTISLSDRFVRSYDEPVTIPSHMVVGTEFIGTQITDFGAAVPLGSALCSFVATEQPPQGYEWIAKGNRWPDEVWMGHLKGQEMPDTNNLLIAGTQDIDYVGNVATGTNSTNPVTLKISTAREPTTEGKIHWGTRRPILSANADKTTGIYFHNTNPPRSIPYRPDCNFPHNCQGQSSTVPFHEKARIGLVDKNSITAFAFRPQVTLPVIQHFTVDGLSMILNIPILEIPRAETYGSFPRHMPCRWMIRTE